MCIINMYYPHKNGIIFISLLGSLSTFRNTLHRGWGRCLHIYISSCGSSSTQGACTRFNFLESIHRILSRKWIRSVPKRRHQSRGESIQFGCKRADLWPLIRVHPAIYELVLVMRPLLSFSCVFWTMPVEWLRPLLSFSCVFWTMPRT